MNGSRIKIKGALIVQQRQIAQNIRFDFFGLSFGIDLLQIQDNLLDGVLAVAALDNLEAGAVEAEGAFGHEQHTLLVVFAKTASGSQARAAVRFRRHRRCFPIPLRAGKRPGAASRD